MSIERTIKYVKAVIKKEMSEDVNLTPLEIIESLRTEATEVVDTNSETNWKRNSRIIRQNTNRNLNIIFACNSVEDGLLEK